jgi:outer membrane protein TolC
MKFSPNPPQAVAGRPLLRGVAIALCTPLLFAPIHAAELQLSGNPQQRPALATHLQADLQALRLPLAVMVQELLAVHPELQTRELQAALAAEAVTRAEAAFQPQATVSLMQNSTREKNTPEEELLRSGLGIYEREALDLAFGYSQRISTGATLEANITLSKFDSNVAQQRRSDGGELAQDDYRSLYNIGITQPLLRDGWRKAAQSQVEVARIDGRIVEQEGTQEAIRKLAEAMAAYYDLALAEAQLKLWQEGTAKTEDLLREARALQAAGRIAQGDVLDVEGSLLRYQAGLSDAQQQLQSRMNQLRTLLMLRSSRDSAAIVASDGLPQVTAATASSEESLRTALAERADYRAERLRVEREGLQIVFAENQTLPRLDLVASYGINNLEVSAGKALGDFGAASEYPTWKFGLNFAIPLGKDRRGGAELRSAQLRRQEALLRLWQVENSIANDIDSSLVAINNSFQRWQMFNQAAAIELRQIDSERERLRAGRSDMRTLLAREERLINARNAELEQAATWAKAVVALEVAQGTLLQRYR